MTNLTTIITTKLAPPKYAPNLIERPQLMDILDDAELRTLTLVKAAAGFGKTTMLMQWRKSLLVRGQTVAWLTLNDSDDDGARFLAYVVASLQYAGCDVGSGALAIYQSGGEDCLNNAITALVNELHQHRSAVYLFLDDFHHLSGERIHEMLQHLLWYAPVNLHVVVASRTDAPWPIGQLRLQDQVTDIDVAALRFSFADASRYINDRLGIPLSTEELRRLYDVTEGWAVGLQLAVIALRGQKDPHEYLKSFSGVSRNVDEYLTNEVLERLPPKTMKFLINTSILDRLHVDLCNALTGEDDAETLLSHLEADNLFILPAENDPEWYRYHPLFAEFLQNKLIQYPEENRRTLHSRAVHWLKSHGHITEAVEHALAAGLVDLAVDLVDQCAVDLVADGRWDTLATWTTALPKKQLQSRASLQTALAWALIMSYRVDEASKAIASVLPSHADEPHLADLAPEVIPGVIAAYRDDSSEAVRLAEAWHSSAPLQHPFEVGTGANVRTWGYIHGGEYQRARDAQMEARRWDEAEREPGVVIWSKCLIGLSHVMQAEMPRAEKLYVNSLHRAEGLTGRRSVTACMSAAFLSEVLYEQNRLRQARELLAYRFDVIDRTTIPDAMLRAYLTRARLRYAEGEFHEAIELLGRLQTLAQSRDLPRLVAASLGEKIRFSIRNQNVGVAEDLLTELQGLAKGFSDVKRTTHSEIPLIAQIAECRVAIAIGQADHAIDLLNNLIADCDVIARRYLATELRNLLAVAQKKCSQHDASEDTARLSLEAAAEYGLIRIFVDAGGECVELLRSLRDHSKNPPTDVVADHLSRILNAARQQPKTTDAHGSEKEIETQKLLRQLSARERELLSLLAQGLPNKRIAQALNLSVDTVKWHLKNLYGKLGVGSRHQAADIARHQRLKSAQLSGLNSTLPSEH